MNGVRSKGAGKGADGTNWSGSPDRRLVSKWGTTEGLEGWMTDERSQGAAADGCTVFDGWECGANIDNLTGMQTEDGKTAIQPGREELQGKLSGHGHSCNPAKH